ncbi:MAG: mechanosensitive ion channel [Gemmatimonadota bacterium]|nr:MAG: mechanosensitive ion channel [Gemmatimonadota bacterium]
MRHAKPLIRCSLPALTLLLLQSSPVLSDPVLAQVIPAAQQTSGDTARADTIPAIIPASQIGRAAEEAVAQILQIRSGLALDPALFAIDSALTPFTKSLEELRQRSDSGRLAGMSLRSMDDLLGRWRNREDQVRRWQQSLEVESGELDAARDSLAEIRRVWEATLQSARDQELPEAMAATIQSVLESVGESEAELAASRDALLTILSRVSQMGTEIAQWEATVEQAAVGARRRILSADSRPLWEALFVPGDSLAVGHNLRSTWDENRAHISDFIAEHEQQLLVQLLLLAALVVALIGLQRSVQRWGADDEDLKPSAHILSRPFSTALVLTLLCTRLLHPRAPTVVYDIAGFLWLIPVLRLVPGILKPAMRVAAYGLMGLYAFAEITDPLASYALGSRLVLLLLTVLAFAGLAYTIRSGGADRIPGSGLWRRVGIFVSRVALLLLAVSFAANVLGFVRLSFLLTRATLTSAFAALIGLVLVEVLKGVTVALLRRGPARWLRSVRFSYGVLIRRITRLVNLGVLILWLAVSLNQFELLVPIWNLLVQILVREWTVGSWQISLADIIAFLLALWLAVWISRTIRAVLREDVLPRMELGRGVPQTVSTMAHYLVLLIGFMVAAGAAGFDLTKVTLLAGALGVGIGFGLQNVVNNFISGLILMFERPIQIGDTIDIENLRGVVKQIGIRASIVRTYDGAEVIVPNGDLIAGRVTNWTLSDRLRRIELPVGVAYGSDPKYILKILEETAKKHEDVLDDPAPFGQFIGFGESSLDFVLRFWTAKFEEWLTVSSRVAVAVNDALLEAGIEIPFPQRDLHLRSVSENTFEALTRKSTNGSDSQC